MAAAIGIKNTPAQNLTYKMYPVYNGLPFVVESNRTTRNNFKYSADIYVNSTKVTTLKHNKDISANNSGIFDIGRVVENFIETSTSNFATYGFGGNTNTYKQYQVKFGCEYERYLNITTIINSSGYARVNFANSEHDFRVGDGIVIQNASVAAYNGNWIVSVVGSNYVRINKTYVSNSTGGLAIEGEVFYDNTYYDNQAIGGLYTAFAIPASRPTRINIGDTVIVKQDVGATFIGYDGEWLVIDKFTRVIGGQSFTCIAINHPLEGNTPVNGGVIYSKDKYKLTDLAVSTAEYTWDAGLQYEDINAYNSTNYAMNTTYKGKFLTNAPSSQYIRLNEIGTLSHFNTSIMGSSIKYMKTKTYNSAGTLLNTYSNTLGSATSVWVRLEVGVGTKNLSTLGVSWTNVHHYTVELWNSSNQLISEIRTYIIDNKCTRYTPKRFKWKNRLGGWDFFTFNLRSDKKINIEKSTYRKAMKHYTAGTPPTYGFSKGDRGAKVYNVNANDSELVFSDWLTGEEAAWLEELWTSPEVFIMDDAGTSELPIVITDSELTIGEKENRGLISYAINYTNAYNKIIQRG